MITRRLASDGCDVIANHVDNARALTRAEQLGVRSISNVHVDACTRAGRTCIGTVYLDWREELTSLFCALYVVVEARASCNA